MKKILVTGASGFVGKAVIDSLLSNCNFEIHAIVRKQLCSQTQVKCHVCDLMDYESVCKVVGEIKPDYLIHLAWDVNHATYLHSDENLLWVAASLNLLKSFKQNGGERVFISGTCFEDISHLPLYAASKLSLKSLAISYCELNNISIAWGRLFYLFGENEKIERVTPYVITQLLKNEKVVCKNSSAIRDFMYIVDAGNAIVQTLFSDVQGQLDIASGCSITMKSLFTEIGASVGMPENIIFEDNSINPQKVVADASKLRNVVKFNTFTPLDDALKCTVEYWKDLQNE